MNHYIIQNTTTSKDNTCKQKILFVDIITVQVLKFKNETSYFV